MPINPMQQQQSPDMLMAMMTDPRASPQQRMAAMSALNALKGGANAPAPPQMTGDSTGVSTINPAFMAAVRQEVMGQGPEEQPEIAQRQAAPEAQQDPTTQALMSGAADASRVAAMAHGGAVRGYAPGGEVTGGYGKKYTYGPLSVGPFYPQNLPFGLGKLFDDNQDPNEEVDLLAAEDAARARGRESIANRDKANIEAIKEQLLDPNISDFLKSNLRSRLSVLEQNSKADLRRNTEIAPSFKNTDLYQYFVPQSEKIEIKNKQADAVAEQQRLRGESQEPLVLQSIEDLKKAPPLQDYGVGTPYEKPITLNTPDFFNAPARRAEAAVAAQAAPPPPPAAAQAPAPAVDPAAEAMNAQRQSESDAYKKRMEELLSGDQPLSSQDKYMALLQAGLGTMASASKPGATFLGSIGEGGMSGVQSLDELRKERAVNRMKQATMLQAQRSEDLTAEDRARTADREEKKLAWDMNPINPAYKENLARAKYYADVGAAAGKTTTSALSEKLAVQNQIDAMPDGPDKVAAQERFDKLIGATPKGMSQDDINKRIQEESMAAEKDFDRDWSADMRNMSKTAEQKAAERAAYVARRIARARDIFGSTNSGAAPPPAGGASSAVNDALNKYQ